MDHKLIQNANKYGKRRQQKRLWQKIVGVLACIVVFCTTYALILPAITLEKEPICGIPAHRHSEACYAAAQAIAVCTPQALGIHEHTLACYDDDGVLICGYADFVVHTHDAACFDADGNLWCTLPEIQTHIHTESCYSTIIHTTSSAHTHTQDCYTTVRSELTCTLETGDGHVHETECFDENEELICTLEESSGHQHSDDCYTLETILICTLSTEPDKTNEAVESVLTCGYEEIVLHEHTADCYDVAGNLLCGKLQIVEHKHDSNCFITDETAEPMLMCGKVEHQHTDACFGISTADVSDGPVFIIAAQRKAQLLQTADLSNFSFMISTYTAGTQPTDLKDYIENNNGTLFFSLTDANNKEPSKDSDGNYIVMADQLYKLALGISLPNGIHPGTYQYQLPQGLTVNGGDGEFILADEGVNIGTWSVDNNGLITFIFNEYADNYTEMTISAVMGVFFSESDVPINFDGKISVVVEKPPLEETGTEINKWARNPSEIQNADPNKIYWEVEIIGGTASNIVGNTLTDTVYTKNGVTHTYTQSDMDAGISIEAYEYDAQGECITGHKWIVYPDDPDLVWTETGWSYIMPEHVPACEWCEETNFPIGNHNWMYYIKYTSTTCDTLSQGYVVYRNTVSTDNTYGEGWTQRQKGSSSAGITKAGVFQGNENGGKYIWTITAVIPGLASGQKADYFWHLWDWMEIQDASGNALGYVENTLGNAVVTATYGGQTIIVPSYANATAANPFCFRNSWSEDIDGNQIYCGQEIDFYCRCQCTEENCPNWVNGACTDRRSNGFCKCWTVVEDVTFTFQYETEALELLENYGGTGAVLDNYVELDNQQRNEDNVWKNIRVDSTSEILPIPGLFEKRLTQDYNGYIAKYTITVNEAMLDLTGGEPLTIHDVMSDTLAFINGSLVITTQDAAGHTGILSYGTDYTITYDGSGTVIDSTTGKPVHVLDIVIQNPQALQYTLNYDATLVIPTGISESVKYANSASVTLFGKTIIRDSDEKIYTDINISAKNYRVEIHKTAADTGNILPGAFFGLYTQTGGLICTGVTDSTGTLRFETNVTNGVILQNHTPYYIQEITPPEHYRLDTEKYWLFFCDEPDICDKCEIIIGDSTYSGIIRIPGETVGTVSVVNEPTAYELPQTGGPSTYVYTTVGFLLMAGAAVLLLYRYTRRRKGDFPSS